MVLPPRFVLPRMPDIAQAQNRARPNQNRDRLVVSVLRSRVINLDEIKPGRGAANQSGGILGITTVTQTLTLVDARRVTAIRFLLTSTLSVAIQCQVIGSFSEQVQGSGAFSYNIGEPEILPSNDSLTLGLVLPDDWFPYFGVLTEQPAATATGSALIQAYVQEWAEVSV